MVSVLLTMNSVHHRFGGRVALAGVTASLPAGVVGLLGPNGSGKTTLLRIVAGVLRPTGGSIDYGQRHSSAAGITNSSIGYLPQELGYFPHFTALDFVEYVAWLHAIPRADRRARAARALTAVGLAASVDVKIKKLSGGMKRRVGVASAIVGDPSLLLLDEPTIGLDIEQREDFRDLVRSLGAERDVLLSSHLADDIAALCDEVIILASNGEVDTSL